NQNICLGAGRDLTTRLTLSVFGAILALFALAMPAGAQEPVALPNVIDARMTATPERVRVVVDLADRTEFSFVSLSEPDRLAIDVRAGTFSVPEPAGTPSDTSMVSSYVIEQAAADRVR